MSAVVPAPLSRKSSMDGDALHHCNPNRSRPPVLSWDMRGHVLRVRYQCSLIHWPIKVKRLKIEWHQSASKKSVKNWQSQAVCQSKTQVHHLVSTHTRGSLVIFSQSGVSEATKFHVLITKICEKVSQIIPFPEEIHSKRDSEPLAFPFSGETGACTRLNLTVAGTDGSADCIVPMHISCTSTALSPQYYCHGKSIMNGNFGSHFADTMNMSDNSAQEPTLTVGLIPLLQTRKQSRKPRLFH